MSLVSRSEHASEHPLFRPGSLAVEALDRYHIFDSPAEAAFDDIARLAASFCQTPIALITFVGERRQWVKSSIGLEGRAVPLEADFCLFTVAGRRMLVVPDALADPRFASHSSIIAEPCIRFYAGVPLLTSDGQAIGTLCVLDRVPRQMTAEQLNGLETLSRQVMALLDLRCAQQALQRTEEENSRLAAERLSETLERRHQEQLYVMSSARCLLWYADIREGGHPTLLHWDARFVNEEAAQKFLPLDIRPGETYKDARYHARLPEDREACDRITLAAVRAGQNYEQEFRCRDANGTIHWLHEDIRVETVVEGLQWRAVGVCTDITDSKRAEQVLRESETLYRTLGEVVPDFIWSCKTNGEALFSNQRLMDYIGLTLEKSDSTPMNVLHHPDDYPRLTEIWKKAAANREPYEAEFRFRRHDGVYRWFMARAVPVKNAQGEIQQWIGTTTDIHERKTAEEALQQSEAQYRQLAEAIPQLVWMTDSSGVPEYFNQRWIDYTGKNLAQILESNRPSVIHAADSENMAVKWSEAIQTGRPYEVEYRLRRVDGVYRWFLARGVPLIDEQGRATRWFGTCTDIDVQKRAEQEIEALNTRLRRSVQETHHRVKNNLQIISALVDLERQEDVEMVPAASLERIGCHARSLAVIHDLLTHQTRINAQANSLSTQETLESLMPLLQATTGERHIRYHTENICLPIQEIGGLSLLVNELIANAVKHGKGDIELTLTMQDGEARLEVCDDGPGFPPDFDWHRAAHTGMNLIDSAGRHELRGSVCFENRPEGGARVVVTFPVLSPS